MPDISKINALAIGSVAKVDGLAKASILDIDGVAVPSAVSAPAAAYSVRLLGSAVGISSYTGDCMRVRRASDNVEADIAFDAGELKLTSGVSNTSDAQSYTDFADFVDHTGTPTSAFVRYWYDQSSNAVDAGQSTAPLQPQIYDATTGLLTENGKPAINFQDDVLFTSSNITLSDGAYFSLCVATTNGSQNNVINASDGTIRVGQFARVDNLNRFQTIGFNSSGGAVTATGPSTGVDTQFLGIGEATGTVLKAYVNGTGGSGVSSFTNRTDAQPFYVGGRNTVPTDGHNGYIQEIIHYSNNQSSNRTSIESDINGFFSIYP